ncbi:hypothetical protein BDZ97DRAFT_1755938 [Flammula alnicola]|nr:hypothetical protein BDZ97DRAFT_1755938 [Flammula alnicola]
MQTLISTVTRQSKRITFGNMTMPAREGSRRTREMVNATRCMATLYLVGMGSDTDDGTGPVRRDSELRTGLEGTPMATNTKAARALGRSTQGPGGYGRPVATAEPSPPLTARTTRACGDMRPMVAMNETSRPLVAPREGIWGASLSIELACIWGHLGILEIWKMLQGMVLWSKGGAFGGVDGLAPINNKLRRRRETHPPNQQPPTAYTLDPSAYTFDIVQHPARASLDGSSALGLQCGVRFPCECRKGVELFGEKRDGSTAFDDCNWCQRSANNAHAYGPRMASRTGTRRQETNRRSSHAVRVRLAASGVDSVRFVVWDGMGTDYDAGGSRAGYTCQRTQPGTRTMLEDWESYPALCQWRPSQQTQNDHQTATDIPAVMQTPPTSAHQPLRRNLRHPALLIDRQLVGRTSSNSGIRWASISMLEGIERDLGQVQRSSGHKETPMPPAREEVRDAYTLETMPPPPLFMLHVVQHIRGPRAWSSFCHAKQWPSSPQHAIHVVVVCVADINQLAWSMHRQEERNGTYPQMPLDDVVDIARTRTRRALADLAIEAGSNICCVGGQLLIPNRHRSRSLCISGEDGKRANTDVGRRCMLVVASLRELLCLRKGIGKGSVMADGGGGATKVAATVLSSSLAAYHF